MGSYSILTRRDNAVRAAAPASPAAEAAVDATVLDEPDILKLRPTPLASEPPTGLPPVVMQVPEVSDERPSGSSRLGSWAYWATVILGALLAVWLIWGPRKAPQRQMDEAPPWSPAAATSTAAAPEWTQDFSGPGALAPTEEAPTNDAPAREAPTNEASTNDAPTEEGSTNGAPLDEGRTNDAPTEEGPTNSAPADEAPLDEASTGPRPDVPIATARVTGVRYSQPPAAGPGEATPLGISTPVAR